jgi:hypothetical protein
VRASFLRWLIATRTGAAGNADGLRLVGMRICGPLDLTGLTLDRPLVLRDCTLDDIVLVDAHIPTVDLGGSSCTGIAADRMRIDGGLLLNAGFSSAGGVHLRDVTVAGDVNCDSCTIVEDKCKWSALVFAGARIGGRLFLTNGRFRGGVQGVCAHVAGGVVANDACFVEAERGERALELDGMRTDGRVNLRCCKFDGPVSLANARVGGSVALVDATIGASDKAGLRFAQAHIAGEVDLRRLKVGARRARSRSPEDPERPLAELDDLPFCLGPTAEWSVDGTGAQIGHDLNLRAAELGGGLRLSSARVDGGARFRLRHLRREHERRDAGRARPRAARGAPRNARARWCSAVRTSASSTTSSMPGRPTARYCAASSTTPSRTGAAGGGRARPAAAGCATCRARTRRSPTSSSSA